MEITTKAGNTYYYSPTSNKIVASNEDVVDTQFTLYPLGHIREFEKTDNFIIGITEKCNLRCSYCYYSGSYLGQRTHSALSFQKKNVDALLSFIEKYYKRVPFTIGFYGGECFLEYELIQEICEKASVLWRDKVRFSISTNGTCLNDEKFLWLKHNHVELVVSLDGSKEHHDFSRKYPSGQGSYDLIMSNLKTLSIGCPDYFNECVKVTITFSNLNNLQEIAYDFQKDDFLRRLQVISVGRITQNYSTLERLTDLKREYQLMAELLEFYSENLNNAVLKTYFTSIIEEWAGREIREMPVSVPVNSCVPSNHKIYINAKGNVFICERVGLDSSIGNIYDGIDWARVNRVNDDFSQTRKAYCENCEIYRICGFCIANKNLKNQQMNWFCKNERQRTELSLLAFCELAERGLIR